MASDPSSSAAPVPDEANTGVLVVGAGPAGLAAAGVLLQRSQVQVTVVDAGVAPGGQYWRQPGPGSGPGALADRSLRSLHHDLPVFDELRALLAAGERDGRLELLSGHHVWTVVPDGSGYAAHLLARDRPGPERPLVRRASAVLLATGAYDRVLPLPGWDLPGVMTVGGLQALLKGNDVLAGRRVAVGGTGPFLLPVAAALAARGARVVGVFEANPPTGWLRHAGAVVGNVGKLGEGLGYATALARHRVPVRVRVMISAAHGTDRVEAVTTVRLDRWGARLPGTEERHAVDAVGLGWGFTPHLDLALPLGCELGAEPDGTRVVRVDADQASSVPGVYVAGEACGVGGAALAVAEGRLAAAAILRRLHGYARAAPGERRDRRAVGRLRRFATALPDVYPVPPGWREGLTPDTVFCRCEETTYAAVQSAMSRHGCHDARQLKQLTRVGMGWCQGRVCGYAADLVTHGSAGAPGERLLAGPVTLAALATLAERTNAPGA